MGNKTAASRQQPGAAVAGLNRPRKSMTQLLRFSGPVAPDSAIESWMKERPGELGMIAKRWFEVMRKCGSEVRELLHDGHPTACVEDAGFAYVNAFRTHVNVGFFRGDQITDPSGLLEGTGKFMRHVKIGPGAPVDAIALTKLIETAYVDMMERVRLEKESGQASSPTAGRSRRS
jgi:hypothetical protein